MFTLYFTGWDPRHSQEPVDPPKFWADSPGPLIKKCYREPCHHNHSILQGIIVEYLETFEFFGKSSGLKMNYNKTEVLRTGWMKYSDNTIHTKIEITWTTESLTILGIEISVKRDIEKINIEPIINKIENIIKIWSWRHLVWQSYHHKLPIFITTDIQIYCATNPSNQ